MGVVGRLPTIGVMDDEDRPTLDRTALARLLGQQSGVVSRRQVLDLGGQPHDLRAMVRRRDLVRVHHGVYVNHTGELSWPQRAWAGVLCAWPAALWGPSALRAADGPGRRDSDDRIIHVAVAGDRHLKSPTDVKLHRVDQFDDRVQWNLSPPRFRYDEAALDVAIVADSEFAAITALARACQTRHTHASRLLASLATRERVPRRYWLASVLRDVESGTHSVLERGYLDRVERAHGLPRPERQATAAGPSNVIYRDVEYAERLVVELDGRLFHDTATARDQDMDRDLDAAVDGRQTVRLSWGQVFDRPCRTADRIGRLLQQRGWTGALHPCGSRCDLDKLDQRGVALAG